jgi:hypothetical protein
MDGDEKIAAAGLRAAKLKVEETQKAARAVVTALNREAGDHEICHAAAVVVAKSKASMRHDRLPT